MNARCHTAHRRIFGAGAGDQPGDVRAVPVGVRRRHRDGQLTQREVIEGRDRRGQFGGGVDPGIDNGHAHAGARAARVGQAQRVAQRVGQRQGILSEPAHLHRGVEADRLHPRLFRQPLQLGGADLGVHGVRAAEFAAELRPAEPQRVPQVSTPALGSADDDVHLRRGLGRQHIAQDGVYPAPPLSALRPQGRYAHREDEAGNPDNAFEDLRDPLARWHAPRGCRLGLSLIVIHVVPHGSVVCPYRRTRTRHQD